MKNKVLSATKKKVSLRIKLSPVGARRRPRNPDKRALEIFQTLFSTGGMRREMTSQEKKTYVEVLVNTGSEERRLLARVASLLRNRQRRMGRALVK
jgi:hypothetical protein